MATTADTKIYGYTPHKDQLLKTAYYETARNEAKVVNYMSRTVFADASKAAK